MLAQLPFSVATVGIVATILNATPAPVVAPAPTSAQRQRRSSGFATLKAERIATVTPHLAQVPAEAPAPLKIHSEAYNHE
ncbi:MAG TPA: hypothetical protein VGK33_17365 [Chloroflexota bacterium]